MLGNFLLQTFSICKWFSWREHRERIGVLWFSWVCSVGEERFPGVGILRGFAMLWVSIALQLELWIEVSMWVCSMCYGIPVCVMMGVF